jgi:hypothetical protein
MGMEPQKFIPAGSPKVRENQLFKAYGGSFFAAFEIQPQASA